MAYVYRADQVGALVSPVQLSRDSSGESATAAEDAAIKAVLLLQKESGIDVVTDGELRRRSACSMFVEAVAGVQHAPDAKSTAHILGRLARKSRLTAVEVEFLKRNAGARFKICLPSPCTAALAFYRDEARSVYPTLRDAAMALAEIIRQEVRDLVAESVGYIQLNCPTYELAGDASSGFESATDMMRVDAAALSDVGKTADISLAVHLPRAHQSAPAARARILEDAFAHLPADRFLIEFDHSPQEADFAPLRAVPERKIAVLGLVDVLAPRVDEVDPVLDKIDQAAEFLAAERLALSPQRSFNDQAGLSRAKALQAQKDALTLTAEGAHRYWGIEL